VQHEREPLGGAERVEHHEQRHTNGLGQKPRLDRTLARVTDGSYALIGGGAVLPASMQGPLCATVLMLELTHSTGSLTVPLLLAVGAATVTARLLGAPSIYSARLTGPAPTPAPALQT
jgi:H+/Cl- antiporter ClcA